MAEFLRSLETGPGDTHLPIITRFDGFLQWRLPRVRSCPGQKGRSPQGSSALSFLVPALFPHSSK
jgi:hypothetical protein